MVPATYLEDQDMWCLSGIFQDVTVISRSAGTVEDFFVQADFDHTTGVGPLLIDTDVPTLLPVPELGLHNVPAIDTHLLDDAEPWSTEQRRSRPRPSGHSGRHGP